MAISASVPKSPSPITGEVPRASPRDAGRLFFAWFVEKAGGKSSGPSMIPKRNNQKHVFLTADRNTMNGLVKFHTGRFIAEGMKKDDAFEAADKWLGENIIVWELQKYRDPTNPEAAFKSKKHTLDCFHRADEMSREGSVCGLFVEHYEKLHGETGIDLVRAEWNLGPGEFPKGKQAPQQWQTRSGLLDEIDDLMFYAKTDCLAIINYPEQDIEEWKPNADGKLAPQVTKQLPRAITKRAIIADAQVRIDGWVDVSKREIGSQVIADKRYMATVRTSQHLHFDEGDTKDITGVGLAPFFGDWWAEHLAAQGGSA